MRLYSRILDGVYAHHTETSTLSCETLCHVLELTHRQIWCAETSTLIANGACLQVSLVLINLLIAMMSSTYDDINQGAKRQVTPCSRHTPGQLHETHKPHLYETHKSYNHETNKYYMKQKSTISGASMTNKYLPCKGHAYVEAKTKGFNPCSTRVCARTTRLTTWARSMGALICSRSIRNPNLF